MSTDRVFREEDAIWWDANVRGPSRYSYREMDEDYEGLSPFSNNQPTEPPRTVEHVHVIDPDYVERVGIDVSWMNIIALVILMLGAVAVVAIFAFAAVAAVVMVGVVLGIMFLVFGKS